jgi:hypothetical protein
MKAPVMPLVTSLWCEVTLVAAVAIVPIILMMLPCVRFTDGLLTGGCTLALMPCGSIKCL